MSPPQGSHFLFRDAPASGKGGGFSRIRRVLSRHLWDQKPMKTATKDTDLRQVFSRFLLIATLFTPRQLENEKQNLARILESTGLTITRSDCIILEKDRIGDSQITIARYSLEYRDSDDNGKETLCIEGDIAMQTDLRGSVNITISAKPGISLLGFEAVQSDGPLFGDEAGPSPLPS